MWVFTTDGFYSVVQDRNDPDRLVIRSRWREDLVNFLRKIGRKDLLKTIIESDMTDYEFRVFVPRIYWAEFLRLHSSIMDYHNFKDEVHLIDPERSRLYANVWSVVACGVRRTWDYLMDSTIGEPMGWVFKGLGKGERKAARKKVSPDGDKKIGGEGNEKNSFLIKKLFLGIDEKQEKVYIND